MLALHIWLSLWRYFFNLNKLGFFMGIYGLKETSHFKVHHLGTVTPSGRPISTQTEARIRTHVLRDPKAPRAQAVPLYHGVMYRMTPQQGSSVQGCLLSCYGSEQSNISITRPCRSVSQCFIYETMLTQLPSRWLETVVYEAEAGYNACTFTAVWVCGSTNRFMEGGREW